MEKWSYNGLASLLLTTLLVGGVINPVHGGLMDFGPPGMIQYGTCAQPKSNEDFKFEQFSGLWYQVEMVPNSYMEAKKCITLHFMWNGSDAFNVTTHGLNEYNEETVQVGRISKVEPKDPVTMKPYLQIWAPGVPPVPYHVIETDYHNFACVYSCYELFSLMFEAFSVLIRHSEMQRNSLAACHRAFGNMELDLTRLQPVQQTGECLGYQQVLEGSGGSLDLLEDEDEDTFVELTRGNLIPQGGSLDLLEDEDEDTFVEFTRGNLRPQGGSLDLLEDEDEDTFLEFTRGNLIPQGEEHTVTISQRKPQESWEKQEEGESGSAPTLTPTPLLFIMFTPLLWFRD